MKVKLHPRLRTRIILYLVLVHVGFGGIGFAVLHASRYWLLAVEALLALSIAGGVLLVRAFFVPLELIRTGTELIAERDFSSRFREAGEPEMDALVRIYNEMVEQLREERLKLREQHYFLDRLLRASPAGVLTLDFDGRVAQLNPAAERLIGVGGGAGMGDGTGTGVLSWSGSGGGLDGEAAGSEGSGAAPRELVDLAPPLGASLAALPVGGSEVLALQGGRRIKASRAEFFDHGFARSFFILEELTEELRASEKAAYGKLIRMLSHEVNNSVGAVGSLLDSFRAYGAQLAPEDRHDFESAVGVAAQRLRNLQGFMNGFAEVVRLPGPELRPTDLGRLLDELLILLRPELERRRIQVAWAERRDPPSLPLDRNQIEQVLVNVLKNAMEAIGEDGRITLCLGADHLAVRDSGPGIPGDVGPLLFTPFFSTKRDGRGLGLTLVREILTHHGFSFHLMNWEGGGDGGGGAEFWMGW